MHHFRHLALAAGIDTDANGDRGRDNLMTTSYPNTGGVQPDRGPLALDRPREKMLPFLAAAAEGQHTFLTDADHTESKENIAAF